MSVKKLLAKQKEDFINLHEVLGGMAATDRSTYQEAAQALCQALRDASEGQVIWYQKSPTSPKKMLTDAATVEAFKCLEQAARHGVAPQCAGDDIAWLEYAELHGDMRSLGQFTGYGFDRGQILIFLKSLGIEIESMSMPPEDAGMVAGINASPPRMGNTDSTTSEQLTQALVEIQR